MSAATSRPLVAALWMVGATISFSAMAVAGRELWRELNTFELMLYRSVIGFVIVCILVKRSSLGIAQLRTEQPLLHAKRNIIHFAAQNMWFYGVAVIALSQLVALEFTNPIWVALIAPIMLGEAFTRARVAAAILGFLGVLVIAQPGVQPLTLGHLAGLGAAIGFAFNTLYTKQIMGRDTVLCVLFWMTLSQAVMAFCLSLPGGIPWPSPAAMPWIAVVGICGLTAHYCLTSALGAAPATLVAPLEFMRLPVVALLGAMIYSEPLLISIFIGAGQIFVGNMINIRAEQRRKTQH